MKKVKSILASALALLTVGVCASCNNASSGSKAALKIQYSNAANSEQNLANNLKKAFVKKMADEGMNVASAERYVERLLTEKKPRSRHTGVIKDIRLFYNSLDRAMRMVKESGIGIRSERHESDDAIEVIIRINKKHEA